MKELNNDFYCTSNKCWRSITSEKTCEKDFHCGYKKHRWPTPEQFKEEYGFEYPEDGAVYALVFENGPWEIHSFKIVKITRPRFAVIVCACTPWGKPPNTWKPS